jgi:peptidoglycan/LPS O-acetylase OafA/YrhL
VLFVIWHHSHPGWSWLPASHNGFLGVDIFFILSGFLISKLLLDEQRRTDGISLSNFYVRRSLRIFPLYFTVIGAMALYFAFLAGPGSSQAAAFLRELPYHATFTSNWSHIETMMSITWSLSTEEQFYLVWPPLLAWLGTRAWPWLLVFLALNQLVNFGALDDALATIGLPFEEHEVLQSTFTPIALGVLLALAYSTPAWRQALQSRLSSSDRPWLLLGLVLLVANVPGDFRGWPRLAFHVTVTLLLASVLLQPQHRVVRSLEWRPLAYVGTVSYGVYLLHMIVLDGAHRLASRLSQPADPLVLFLACSAATVVCAGASYHWFERPLLRLRDRFR